MAPATFEFLPFGQDVVRDPYPIYDRMREAERARLASMTRAAQEHKAKVRGAISAFVAVLSLPFKH